MRYLIVTQGQKRLVIGNRGTTPDGLPTKRPVLCFTPWDLDNEGFWCSLEVDEDIWNRLIEGKDVFPQFETLGRFLAWVETQPDYFFGSPFTGQRFEKLADYVAHYQEQVEKLRHIIEQDLKPKKGKEK